MNYPEVMQSVFSWDIVSPDQETLTVPFHDSGLADIAEEEIKHYGYEVERKEKSGMTFLIVKRKV